MEEQPFITLVSVHATFHLVSADAAIKSLLADAAFLGVSTDAAFHGVSTDSVSSSIHFSPVIGIRAGSNRARNWRSERGKSLGDDGPAARSGTAAHGKNSICSWTQTCAIVQSTWRTRLLDYPEVKTIACRLAHSICLLVTVKDDGGCCEGQSKDDRHVLTRRVPNHQHFTALFRRKGALDCPRWEMNSTPMFATSIVELQSIGALTRLVDPVHRESSGSFAARGHELDLAAATSSRSHSAVHTLPIPIRNIQVGFDVVR